MIGRAILAPLLVGLCSAAGCTKSYLAGVGAYQPGHPKVMMTVPMTGIYSVRLVQDAKGGMPAVDGTETLLYQGELAGFETDDEGQVVATGGQRRIVLDKLPPGTRYCLWYHYTTRQTQFGREVDKALDFTGKALVVAGVTAGTVGMLYLAAQDDCDSCGCGRDCRCANCRCHRR
jgi:hypothetical protein